MLRTIFKIYSTESNYNSKSKIRSDEDFSIMFIYFFDYLREMFKNKEVNYILPYVEILADDEDVEKIKEFFEICKDFFKNIALEEDVLDATN